MGIFYASTGKSKPDIQVVKSSATSAVALSTGTVTSKAFRLISITAKGASSVASALTVTLNSKEGSSYDTLLSSNSSWTDLFIGFGEEAIFQAGDTIDVACADAAILKSVIIRIELL